MATELSLVWPQVQSNYELYEIIKETEQHRIYRGICNFDADLDTGKAPHPREVAIKVIDADMLTIEQIETIRVGYEQKTRKVVSLSSYRKKLSPHDQTIIPML